MGNEEMEETELIEWLRRKAPLEQLCEAGGWPDKKAATRTAFLCSTP